MRRSFSLALPHVVFQCVLLFLHLLQPAAAGEELTWGIQSSCAGCSHVVGNVVEYTYNEVHSMPISHSNPPDTPHAEREGVCSCRGWEGGEAEGFVGFSSDLNASRSSTWNATVRLARHYAFAQPRSRPSPIQISLSNNPSPVNPGHRFHA